MSAKDGREIEESLITFPCDFQIKVMGKNTQAFETEIFNIVKKYFSDLTNAQVNKRLSKDSTYVALTISVFAQNKAQMDALYEELSACKSVLMAL
jgi:putative lipoic acid-binding regulatory protein